MAHSKPCLLDYLVNIAVQPICWGNRAGICKTALFLTLVGKLAIFKKKGIPIIININLIKSEFNPDRIDDKYVLSDLVRKYVLTPGTKTFKTSIKYDLDIARTVLSTMGNRHRAGVDNYMTDKCDKTKDNDVSKLRMLTEREALRLMGFSDDFKIVVSRAQMYKQAGNSIVVDVLIAILKQMDITKYGI